ncbi:hypothetical protein [Metabacillus sp. B2-18]|uniref:hypothetical protein n=1 Tax=Metabacillus sp. B2-18 TaxID=2897333 RepID=UPI001E4F7981|nr:hypothetical protein [Metabacillus sp. B2-18]UGB29947.1 hypothetical protein LPC09_19845 [Metabacillus sp. B2-18]
MSNLYSVIIEGQQYKPVIENNEIVSIKKYSAKYCMWVTLKFTGSNENAENELLELLKSEYISQMSEGNG